MEKRTLKIYTVVNTLNSEVVANLTDPKKATLLMISNPRYKTSERELDIIDNKDIENVSKILNMKI